ncbi:MAG TPA: hypothetical protein VIK51_16190, partial [Vicinamibacteria bacterium]
MSRDPHARSEPRHALPSVAAALVVVALGAARSASGADFLPAVSLHLEAARYAPVETDLHWT